MVFAGLLLVAVAGSSSPLPFDLSSRSIVLTTEAAGAQIYECKATSGGSAWTFREPIATLMRDGNTIGRHYAGPHWALDDGSAVQGKQADSAPGPSASDIPQLKLTVVGHSGHGLLDQANAVYRVRTNGGVLKGACETAGELRSVPYSATYVFTR